MKISTKGRYGLRIMIDIAVNGRQNAVSIKDIALRRRLSEKYLERIINLLSKANLVQSTRGAKGGYSLSKPSNEITVLDILLATEGSLAPTPCAEDNDLCTSYNDCVTSFIWTEIYNATINVCKNITLFQLVEKSDGTTANCKS